MNQSGSRLAVLPSEAPKNCQLCPRLVDFREETASREPDWFNGAVPSFGDEKARLLIVGLAPGLRGANRTGRPFTGDGSGYTLFRMLDKFGFVSGTFTNEANDTLKLTDVMITNAVRCVPPQNRPVGAEINACRPYLAARLDGLKHLRLILTLGKIAHDSTVRALGLRLRDYAFGHSLAYTITQGEKHDAPLTLLSSYHCSRYNLNTGRLTEPMFEDVFRRAAKILAMAG
ncbi:MAG: uracil-DNA glycosylase [Pseudomonadota bacterium]